jgi:vancomycin resistance protein YoaR
MRVDAGVSAPPRDRAFYEERRRAQARAARKRRRIVAGGVAALALLAVGAGAGLAGSADEIAEGVTIAGVDVGGMTAEEATLLLERKAAASAAQPVVFVHGGESFPLTAAKLGATTDWSAAVEQALEESDGFILFRGFERLKLRLSGAEVEPVAETEASLVAEQVARIAKQLDRAPREASIILEGLRPVVQNAGPGAELDRAAAAAVIASAVAGFERGEPVALPVRVIEPEVKAADLQPVAARVRTVLSGPVELSYKRVRVTLGPTKLATLLLLPAGGSKQLAIGGKEADRYFAGLAKEVDRKPQDADFELASGGQVHIVPSREGRRLDVQETRKALLAAALTTVPAERSAALVIATAKPELSTTDVRKMGIVDVVSSYTTEYGGDPNRIHNVQLVAQLIDDHLIPPGAVFSFNQTTGERNADKGFLEAPVIINGELETGLGGGVCQVSTTVFNAAFEAGLSIEERTNHALYISHYPTGRDATVNYPDTDLKFTNDTGHWLWLRAFADSSSLTINLYGTPVDREVVVETSPLKVTGPVPVERVKDPDVYVGERWVEDSGEPARSVSVRRIVYDADGNVLYDSTWFSSYRAEPRIVHVGTKPKPVEEKPPKDSSTAGAADSGSKGSSQGVESGGARSGGGSGSSQGGGAAGGNSPPPAEEPPPSSGGGTPEPPPPPP